MKLKNLIKEEKFQEDDFITPEDVVNLKKKILGYECYQDQMSGSLEWFKKGQEGMLWATPSWDGSWGKTPFDMIDADGNGTHVGDLDFSKNSKKYIGNKKLQMKEYLSAVKAALQKLEKTLK